jgi:hypothetical protein
MNMKKLAFYMSLVVTGLLMAACNEDFKDWAEQKTYLPEDAVTIPGYTASAASATGIDLNTVTEETVKLISLSGAALPEGYLLSGVRAYISPTDIDEAEPTILNALDAEGNFSKSALQEAVVKYYGPRPAPRTFNCHVYADAVKDGQGVLIDAGDINITLTPVAPQISNNYYLIGGPNDWKESAVNKTLKFTHSGKDVYEDPVFTVVFAASEGDTWFAFGDDEACEAIAGDDWSKLFGTTGDSKDAEGTFDYRYNLGGEHSFCVPAGAKFIKVTLNMMDRTYKIEAVNVAESYYLIGGPNSEWNSNKNKKFSHSDKDVFEDPIFTYVFEGNGGTGDIWFTFGDDEAMDAVGNNDWTKLFGYKDEFDLTGKFERRYIMGEGVENTFHVDGKAKFYRFTINALQMTYEITPLNFQEYIYEAGCNNNWGDYQQPLYCADGNGTYTGYFYAKDDSWTDGKGAFKFRGAAGNWDNGNYGTGTFDDATLTGTLIDDGGSGNIMPAPGFYRADVNLADMSFKLTAINSVYVVGSAVGNDWDNGVAMTFNHDKHCWECDATFTEAGVIKFKGNGTWDSADGNWGGTMDNIINGSNDNIPVTLSGNVHIEFYPLCDTKSYCTITAK